ncbi:hypothetical protein L3X38_031582 [Prunus dulcis]|uniref:Uncharacterized protein n=1 Tax=Prunus dulcis TaxID=3755 RepID=A0AAD4YV22_PRUDU|nr:hypothetical protein L3X38_031582 [Prunus dulcis]
MGKGAGLKVVLLLAARTHEFPLVLTMACLGFGASNVLEVFLGYFQDAGPFPKVMGLLFSLMLTHMFGIKKWAWILVLPSSPKLPLLESSMDLVNTRNHPYHNQPSKPKYSHGLGLLKHVAWLGGKIKVFRLALRVILLMLELCHIVMGYGLAKWHSMG